ncbi:MAG: helix-turn-helix transcriptional regulator [Ruminococcaceae bacterium]|nr:helix-turn-helix transcriptional regulator [Oscillospiraceae bacterium]
MDKVELGKKIKEARIGKGYTQEVLAEKSGIGPIYLGEIERGLKMPSLKVFIRIVESLDISADYILRDELPSGKDYVFDELTEKLSELTPKQRKAAAAILDAFIATL